MPSGQQKTFLILLLGVPGSGKSYFAQNLSNKINSVHLNSDAMRQAIFRSRDETDKIYNSENRSVLNTYTFGALNYAAATLLGSGVSVVYDANNNSRQERLDTVKAMQNTIIVPVVVQIQTPLEVAVNRVQERDETATQRKLSQDVSRTYIHKVSEEIEPPDESENAITVNGTIPFDEQFMSFEKQLKEIIS